MEWVLHSAAHVGLRRRWGGAEVEEGKFELEDKATSPRVVSSKRGEVSRESEGKKEKETGGTTGDNNQAQPIAATSHRDDQSDLCILGRSG